MNRVVSRTHAVIRRTELKTIMKTNVCFGFSIFKLLIASVRSSQPTASGRGCWRSLIRLQKLNLAIWLLAMMMLLAGVRQAVALPTIVSTVPSQGATGVTPGAAVVFTFSTNMDTAVTSALFVDVTASDETNIGDLSPTVVSSWSAGNTVLTYTPSPQFANNHTISWSVNGQDTMGNPLTGTTQGSFTTVAGVNGGSGTNAITTFLLEKLALYLQSTNGPPALRGYEFNEQSTLASNRTATAISLTIPSTPPGTNFLGENLVYPQLYQTQPTTNAFGNFDTNFPTVGNYVFDVTNSVTGSNQQVTVNLPNDPLPNAPQIINFTNAHAINPSQPFTLNWNPFTNGTSADLIVVQINEPSQNGNSGPLLFQTSFAGPPAGLDGTATSVTIPANTLPANSTNDAFVFFAHVAFTTGTGFSTSAAVGSADYFTIITTNAAPVLTIIPAGTNVLLEWPTNTIGYNLEFSTNLASSVWSTNLPAPIVFNTNNVVTNGISGTTRFFRLSNP